MSLPKIRTLTYLLIVVVTNFLCLYSGWVWRDGSEALPTSRHPYRHIPTDISIPARQFPMLHKAFQTKPQMVHNRNSAIKKATILKLLQSFRPGMTVKETELISLIFRQFVTFMHSNGLAYFIYGGSLLGSLRHHGVIPWDDDVDIIVAMRHRRYIYTFLNSLRPHYFLDVKQKTRWKFYSALSRPIRGYTWSWPFLDISFYDENSTHIWDIDSKFSDTFVYDKSRIFPLQRRPFMDMMVLAPIDSHAVLLQNYDLDVCESNVYNHRSERSTPSLTRKSVPCSILKDIFPFVKRTHVLRGINETLEIKGRVLKWFLNPSIAQDTI